MQPAPDQLTIPCLRPNGPRPASLNQPNPAHLADVDRYAAAIRSEGHTPSVAFYDLDELGYWAETNGFDPTAGDTAWLWATTTTRRHVWDGSTAVLAQIETTYRALLAEITRTGNAPQHAHEVGNTAYSLLDHLANRIHHTAAITAAARMPGIDQPAYAVAHVTRDGEDVVAERPSALSLLSGTISLGLLTGGAVTLRSPDEAEEGTIRSMQGWALRNGNWVPMTATELADRWQTRAGSDVIYTDAT